MWQHRPHRRCDDSGGELVFHIHRGRLDTGCLLFAAGPCLGSHRDSVITESLTATYSSVHKEKNPTRCNNVSKCYYSIFMWSSTCFGQHTAHHFWYTVASCWIFSLWIVLLCTNLQTSNMHQLLNVPHLINPPVLLDFPFFLFLGIWGGFSNLNNLIKKIKIHNKSSNLVTNAQTLPVNISMWNSPNQQNWS
jgi:hypothetical protein